MSRPRDPFVARAQRLIRLLQSAGYGKGHGVSESGLRRVRQLARRHGTPDWPDIATLEEYDRLIHLVKQHLCPQKH